MQKVIHVFQLLALAALTVVLGELAWTIHRIRPKIEVTISNLDRTVIVAGAAATHLEKAAGTWEQASKAQADNSTKTLNSANATFVTLRAFITKADSQLNAVLLPDVDSMLKQQSTSLLKTQLDLQQNLSQMAQATAEAQKVLADADSQIANPAIGKSIDNLATVTQNTAELTAQAAGTMKAVRSGVEYEVAQIEKPVTKVKVVLLFIVTALGKFFGY